MFATNTAPAAGTSGAHAVTPALNPAVPPTHGDLVVLSGETYTIQPTGGIPQYYQGGNITVQSGGTLIVKNVSLIFVEFVANLGTPLARLSHIYTFTDSGTVQVYNSTITTDINVLNAYAKLNVVVTGSMTLWNSAMRFPGWVSVEGGSAALTLNKSAITGNPNIPGAVEPVVIQADTEYAPSLLVTGGAQLNLFASVVVQTYADNTNTFGVPRPVPLNASDVNLGAADINLTNLYTPSDSTNLTQDWLYPAGVAGGYVDAYFNDTNFLATTTNVQLWYEGVAYPVGTFTFLNNTTGGYVSLAIPSTLTAAINAAGMLTYLNNTGDFGLPSGIALNFSGTVGPTVPISQTQFALNPPLQYNMVATGAGTTVTTADTTLGLTFANQPANPLQQTLPYPWNSNKFLFQDGATGYLANLTLTSAIPGVFSTSALLVDVSSTVYLYRWAQFNITSVGTHYNVSGASATAYYAYNNNQASNQTVTTLNDIQSTNPALWGYVQYWDAYEHGVPRYGVSNITGQASLLLASTVINSSSLPSGDFLGGYNVGFRSPYVNDTTWIAYAVNPYPTGAAVGSSGYGRPDKVSVEVPIAPAVVKFTYYAPQPSSVLDLNNQYSSNGTIFLNGPGTAVIELYATPVGGGNAVLIGYDGAATNGTFDFAWSTLSGLLSAGTTYDLTATATYKTATPANYFLGAFSVPAATSATGFLFQKFLGLPLWLWIAIAVAAVVAILVVLLVFRRQAAGKLVECGECGELIPEDATVCPKCGAEFESDLVRCSRCSSTIPANSQFCPECGAQLLGAPGEGDNDPERQAYADFTEKFRAEGKKELGDNYTESAFWDWWKRQPTYVPFSQWKVQQNKGTPRSGMSEPPVGSAEAAPTTPVKSSAPPTSGPGSPAPGAGAGFTSPPLAAAPPAASSSGALKPCPNCGKEIPPEYLVCPFCGAVTQ
jgi:RNA polymerase subunit RPABC4/transcription elongation factor Spt4